MIVICSHFCNPEGVINGSCVNYEFFLDWGWPFLGCWGGGYFSDTLLVVSILDMVYDCHL